MLAYDAVGYAEAMKQWRPLARASDSNAQSKIALLYAEEPGVKLDYATALVWTCKTATQKNSDALYHLLLRQDPA